MKQLSDKAKQFIISLCREAGDQGTDKELLEGYLFNYMAYEEEIEAAANGDIKAIAELRQIAGLPIFK